MARIKRNDDDEKQKIILSDDEKRQIVQRAAELRESQPDLTGLPLIRKAMEVLPDDRRRRLICQNQVSPWFPRMLDDEAKRRSLEKRESSQDEIVQLLRQIHDDNQMILETNQRILDELRYHRGPEAGQLDVSGPKLDDLTPAIPAGSPPVEGVRDSEAGPGEAGPLLQGSTKLDRPRCGPMPDPHDEILPDWDGFNICWNLFTPCNMNACVCPSGASCCVKSHAKPAREAKKQLFRKDFDETPPQPRTWGGPTGILTPFRGV